MRRLALLTLTALLALAPSGADAASTLPRAGTVAYGGDISWPNCPKGMGIPTRPTLGLPMPTAAAQFVVIGLTNGPGFTPNPCLAAQVAHAKARHLWTAAYAVTSFPTAAQLARYGGAGSQAQRLYRAGAAQAQYNVRNLRKAGLRTPVVWVDVEPVKSAPWSAPRLNNAVIDGAVAAYRASGFRVGFYSYKYGWNQITGGRQLPGVATWVPSGRDTRASAAAKCGTRSFSGGAVLLAQWTYADRDHNITCRGVTGTRFRSLFAAT